jgi:8-oxo-dGTP pyrophosphatase MutT (NUDIX family)
MSAGVILVDRQGRVLMQLRDDDPSIMFPGHWGLTGGASLPGETPEQTARREVAEETGLTLERVDPFRGYYFHETAPGKKAATQRVDYELYLFHAPCETPVEEMVCGEGRGLRFFGPDEVAGIDIAYNHREVLHDFFGSRIYGAYVRGLPFEGSAVDPVARFTEAIDAGVPWFEALMQAIAEWERRDEQVAGRRFSYLVGGEAFDWLLLAERLLIDAGDRVPAREAERLLFAGAPPDGEGGRLDDAALRDLIGDAKHRAHLNYVYGVTVEEALHYALELEVSKETLSVGVRDPRDDETPSDPVYERVYGRPRRELLAQFREEEGRRATRHVSYAEMREFLYWLFKYRVKNSEPARVASDTRKALAQLSAIEEAARRARRTEPVEA